jgi:hypothetical protein
MSTREYIRKEIARGVADSYVRFLLGDDALPESSLPLLSLDELRGMLADEEEAHDDSSEGLQL